MLLIALRLGGLSAARCSEVLMATEWGESVHFLVKDTLLGKHSTNIYNSKVGKAFKVKISTH